MPRTFITKHRLKPNFVVFRVFCSNNTHAKRLFSLPKDTQNLTNVIQGFNSTKSKTHEGKTKSIRLVDREKMLTKHITVIVISHF